MKAFIAGLWTLIVALGATYAVAFVSLPAKPHSEGDGKPPLQLEKTRVINVPMIADGAMRGYIVAQFSYTVDGAKMKALPISPEVFLLDEAFRTIYTDDHLDFHHLDKYDINKFTEHLAEATNKRLGMELVHDILIQDFTFISKEENER